MIINMGGGSTGKKYESGKGTSSTSNEYKKFMQLNGAFANMGFLEINKNLGFLPSLIIIDLKRYDEGHTMVMYKKDGWTTSSKSVVVMDDNVYYQMGSDMRVDENGFCLPWGGGNAISNIDWYAYE